MNADSAANAASGGPRFNREVLARLSAIEQRLQAGDKRFEAMDEHVKECTAEKAKVLLSMAKLEGQVALVVKLLVGMLALMGSGIVAFAIMLP